jgi:glycosyltransferase involved in cell wall biosynthesis
MPAVRIFLLTYRRAHLLPRALASLRAQTFTDWICEVHNDDPADDAPEAIVRAAGDSRLLYRPHAQHEGAVAAFNHAFRGGPEPFASLLEDDNWWDPTFLAEAVAALEAVPAASLIWANMRHWDEEADGSWTDTGHTIWPPAPAGTPAIRFDLPEIIQSVDALHSNGAMVFRPECFDDRTLPPTTPLAIIEQARERAATGPLLLLPQPLAHFARTRRTARSSDRALWLQCQLLLAVSFLQCIPTERAALADLWAATRGRRPRATAPLFATALSLRAPRLVRGARFMDWVWFLAGSLRHPRHLWRGLRFRSAHPTLWPWLVRQSERLGGYQRAAGCRVVDKSKFPTAPAA